MEAPVAKLSFLAGFGAGYVLGARAGRERYEQIRRAYQHAKDDPRLQSAAGMAQAPAAPPTPQGPPRGCRAPPAGPGPAPPPPSTRSRPASGTRPATTTDPSAAGVVRLHRGPPPPPGHLARGPGVAGPGGRAPHG